MHKRVAAGVSLLLALYWLLTPEHAPGQTLVTPERIGRPDAPISITWQAFPIYSLQTSSPGRKQYLLQAAETWIRAHPNVQVVPTVSPGVIFEAMTKLLEQAAARRAPDVAQIDGFFLPRFFPLLQPLDAYVPKAEVADFLPFARGEMTARDGTIRAIRFTTDVRVLYFRKDLVPTPPETWDELITTGGQLAKDKNVAGFLYSAGRDEGAVFDTLLPMLCAQGATLTDPTGRPVFNEGKNREAMLNVFRFLRRTVESGVTPSRVVSIGVSSDINQEAAAGRVAMFIGGNWQIAQLREILPPAEFAKWDVTFIPQMRKGLRGTAAGGWAWGIFTRDPAKQRLAVDFVKALYAGVDGMANWTRVAGYLPTRESVYSHPAYAQDPLVRKFGQMLKVACVRPPVPIYTVISSELQVALGDAVAGRRSPEQALEGAWQKVMEEYQQRR